MFDIGWSEFLVIGVVALIVIGPKELPAVLRAVGQWTTKIRRMAAEFQSQFQEAMREAEMADLKKEVDNLADTAKGFTSGMNAQFDPLDTKEATKWEPKADDKAEIKTEEKAEEKIEAKTAEIDFEEKAAEPASVDAPTAAFVTADGDGVPGDAPSTADPRHDAAAVEPAPVRSPAPVPEGSSPA